MQTSIERKDLSVHFIHDETDDYFVTGEAGLLSQMVINLVANAIKFSHQSKVLEISVRRHPSEDSVGNVVLTIRDHGIGIPPEEIDHLFERFYRASNAVDQQIQGTGLGLAIVAKVAEIHGAKIEVNSELGDGTSITVEFPEGLTRTQALIESRKFSLLAEAIQNVQQTDLELLRAKLHEYGGALGFYDFAEIGEQLLVFSRSLVGKAGEADDAILQRRDELIAKMLELLPPTETGVDNE
jgi:anti-sigma regulatory factor (Ser/Thr protein kinase)